MKSKNRLFFNGIFNKKNILKVCSTALMIPLLAGCSASTINNTKVDFEKKVNDLVENTRLYQDTDITKLSNDNNFRILLKNQYNNPNLVYINKENLNDSIYNNKDLYYQTNTFKMADLVKADINKISKSEKINDINNIVFAYATIYINPKIELLYNNVVLTKNQSDKFELYGIIQIKDTSLSDEEKEYFKFYSKTGVVKYDSGIITIKLNVGDKDEALNI